MIKLLSINKNIIETAQEKKTQRDTHYSITAVIEKTNHTNIYKN
jgi:hypothetical protein